MKAIRLNTKLIGCLDSVIFMTAAEMMKAAKIPSTTWYAIMKKPADITVQHLLAIANGLHVPVRRFFSTEKTDMIGKRDDYIAETFLPCHYDADALQELVSKRADATWQKAAEATGITRDNLRKSLLAVRRTPVERFLTVCEAFSVDPFTILVDPNPRASRKRKPSDTDGELCALRQKVEGLEAKMECLSHQFAILQQRNSDLENAIREYLEPAGFASAAEP